MRGRERDGEKKDEGMEGNERRKEENYEIKEEGGMTEIWKKGGKTEER